MRPRRSTTRRSSCSEPTPSSATGRSATRSGRRRSPRPPPQREVPTVVACEIVKLAPIDAASAPELSEAERALFELTPPDLITEIVTEEGVVAATASAPSSTGRRSCARATRCSCRQPLSRQCGSRSWLSSCPRRDRLHGPERRSGSGTSGQASPTAARDLRLDRRSRPRQGLDTPLPGRRNAAAMRPGLPQARAAGRSVRPGAEERGLHPDLRRPGGGRRHGTFRGEPVNAQFDRGNGCEIARWNRVRSLPDRATCAALRVTHCPVNLAGVGWTNVQALRRRGVDARLVVFNTQPFRPDQADWDLKRPR